mmetsp:Transcript_40773/g.110293  ORF Transcript_40773/g.110293 Transcript_40773/m.110293 type:complete len:352 (-) Transcript_40773:194-1249(-)
MEPETMAYDGDAAAWENWQVAPEPEAAGSWGTAIAAAASDIALKDAEEVAAGAAAVAPTLAYDEGDALAPTIPDCMVGAALAGAFDAHGAAPTLAYASDTVPEDADVAETQEQPEADASPVASTAVTGAAEAAVSPVVEAAAGATLSPARWATATTLGTPPSGARAEAAEAEAAQASASAPPAVAEPAPESAPAAGAAQARKAPPSLQGARVGQRVRLLGKQPRPAVGFYATAVAAAIPAARAARAPRAARAAAPGAAVAAAPAVPRAEPAEAPVPELEAAGAVVGSQVKVRGDGWGGGRGVYEATVTEADEQTFTVVYKNARGKWEETCVLRDHCEASAEASRPGKRKRS